MKKLKVLLRVLIALTLLTTIILTTLLGVTKAEYYKSFKKKIDLEMSPDLKLEYYLYDSKSNDSTEYSAERGSYENGRSFTQTIIIGKNNDSKQTIGSTEKYTGLMVIYQVKIPVTETGYYSLNFNARFRAGLSGNDDKAIFTLNPTLCVGCEIYTASDWTQTNDDGTPKSPFGDRQYQYNYNGVNNNTRTQIPFRVFKEEKRKSQANERVIYSDATISKDASFTDSVYQWKTLCPSRAENVSLAFKATDADVENGYVIWTWDLTGMEGEHNYRLIVENLSVEKNMELNGTTKYRGENDPYFMFPQTAYLNNMVEGTTSNASGYGAGITRHNPGRGTFITNATDNSLAMRAESIFKAQTTDTNHPADSSIDNPLSLYIPLKNVHYNRNYKVTFDFSIAKQGNDKTDNTILGYNPSVSRDWYSYSHVVLNQFKVAPFQSYLSQISNLSTSAPIDNAGHEALRDDLTYKNKDISGAPLTKYDEVTTFGDLQYSTSKSVNDTFSESLDSSGDNTKNRNFFNAVWHTECNGQNEIVWLTFYNTTFSFNINGTGTAALEDLYWIWNIDALRYTGYYNIKIENVRIQEVVDYGSNIVKNGFSIGSTTIDPLNAAHVPNAGQGRTNETGADHDGVDSTTGRDLNAFANFKGRNGTGQNYRARAHVPTSTNHYFVKGNIYAPIVDATAFNAAAYGGTVTDAYKIYLKGWAVLDGGVRRYVFSVDGGRTWENMTFSGGNATATILADAEDNIDQFVQYQSKVSGGRDWITFDENDALNGDFSASSGKALYADLSKYKNQANLDIIIAAVPAANVNLRCEIIRIINYNPIRNYRTYTNAIISDIKVNSYQGTDISTASGSNVTTYLTARYDGLTTNSSGTKVRYDYSENYEPFSRMYGVLSHTGVPGTGGIADAGGYARRTAWSYDYKETRALFSDFPVYDTLAVAGYAIIEGGTEAYHWSADGGETWFECTEVGVLNSANAGGNIVQREWWYDGGSAEFTSGYEKNFFFEFDETTKEHTKYISADLSEYTGKVVDVIFASKPIGSDVYCPVARVDNVGVYGEDGTFHSRVQGLYFDGESVFNMIENDHKNGGSLAKRDKWFIQFDAPAYTIFEPCNVNYENARLLNDFTLTSLPKIESAGEVKIDGYMVCKSGVKRYKFSLDGGDTWSIIYDNASDMADGGAVGAENSDASFGATDGLNGKYIDAADYLTFNLPALEHGTVKELLVVAEANNGKIHPVLKIRFEVTDSNFGYFLYGANGAQTGQYSSPGNNGITQYITTPSNPADTRYKITLPVTETGMHYLSFNEDLNYVAQSKNSADNPNTRILDYINSHSTSMLARNYDSNDIIRGNDPNNQDAFEPGYRYGMGTVGISTVKTQYLEGDTLTVDYNWNVTNLKSYYNSGEPRPEYIAISNAVIVLYPEGADTSEDVVAFGNYYALLPNSDSNTAANPKPTDTIIYKNNSTHTITYSYATTSVVNGSVNINLTDLAPGNYKVVFLNNADLNTATHFSSGWAVKHVYQNHPWYILTEPLTITVNESIDNAISNKMMHDDCEKGENRYFADNCELASTIDNRLTGVPWTNYNHLDAKRVEHYFDVSEEDVKRGYVVLDWDLTELQANTEYVLNLTNIVFESGFRCIHHYVNGFCIKCGQKQPFVLDGSYIYFGDYPQTLKADNVTIDTTNVDANGYYLGSDGKRYAKVNSSNAFSGGEYTFSTGDKLSRGEIYYFKVEPIKWRIVKREGTVLTLMCDSIIDNGAFDATSNIYADSDIRNWFRSDFLYRVFDKYQRALILDSNLGTNLTAEKIYLPSYEDVTNAQYGFSTDQYDLDEARRLNTSDYARAKGAWISLSDWENYYGKGIWMLRTPSGVSGANIRECTHAGEVTNGSFRVNMDDFGIAPMTTIDIAEEFESGGVVPVYSEIRIKADASGNGGGSVRIPVYEPGTYNFSYATYIDTNVEIRHTGLDQTRHYAENGLNFQGSYLSVEKSVYAVGEPIMVDYYSTTSGSKGSNPPLFRNTWIGITRVTGDNARREKWIYYKYVPTNQAGSVAFYGNMPDGNNPESGAELWKGLPAGTYKIYYRNNSANIYHDDPRNNIDNDNGYFYWEDYNITMPITITVVDTAQDNASTTITSYFDDVNVRNSSSGTSYAPVFGSISIPKNTFYADETINFSLYGNVSKHGSNFMIAIYQNDMKKASTLVDSASESISLNGLSPGKYKIYYLSNQKGLLESLYCGGVLACIDITILPTSAKNPSGTVSDNAGGVHTITTYNVKNHNYEFTVTELDAERGYVDIPIEFTGLAPNTDCIFVMDNIFFERKS